VEGEVRRLGRLRCARLKALEDENSKLKKLLAETMLDIAILKDINARKW
jgi:putative transposase